VCYPLLRMLKGPWIVGLLALSLASCSNTDAFICSDDSSCPDGQCEESGYCSFPSDDCASGRRYGDLSGPLSGQCVGEENASGSTSGPSTASGEGTGSPPGVETSGPSTSDPSTSGPTTSDPTDGTGETGVLPGCGAGEMCLELPDGWQGPVRLFTADQRCGDVVAQGALSYSGEWTCECSCDADTPATCDDANAQMELFQGSGCVGDPALTVELTNTCQSFGEGDLYSVLVTGGGPTSCSADTLVDAEPIVASDARTLCSASSTSACPGGTCTADEPGLCIHAEGDLPCPDGFERTVLYDAYEDNRDCSPCSCDAEYTCGGTFSLPSQGCGGGGTVNLAIGACSGAMLAINGGWVASGAGTPAATCENAGGTAMGGIEPSSPRTVCCTP